MARYTVKHHRAVWETTTFVIDVPGPPYADYYDVVAYIRDNLDELMADAIALDDGDGAATIECGDSVASMDSDIEIYDDSGRMLYADARNTDTAEETPP